MDFRLPVDEQNNRAWVEVAHGSRISHRLLALVGDPAQGSNFNQINTLYPFEKVSDRAQAYLVAALEHLMMWADYAAPLKFHEEQVTHFTLRPAYTLARAAIEASAQAVWLMDTRDPVECVRRHLCLIRWDLQELRKSKLEPSDKQFAQLKEDELLRRVASEFSPDQIRAPGGYLNVIRDACAASGLGLDPNDAERLWRAASGAAHGKYWPIIELQQVHIDEESGSGDDRAVRYPDASGMTEVLRAAHTMVNYGVLRYADYSGADIATLLAQATQWLAETVPLLPNVTREDVRSSFGE